MVTGNLKIGGRGRLSRPSLAQSRFGSSVRTEQMNAAGAIGRKKIHAGERMAEVLRARPSVCRWNNHDAMPATQKQASLSSG